MPSKPSPSRRGWFTFDGTYHYSYDIEGNRTERYQLDDYDNKFDITEYTWDNRNRLTSVTCKDSPTDPTPKIVEYTYDVFDRMVSRAVDETGDEVLETRDRYVYDGDHLALQFDKNGDLARRFLHGPAVDQVLAEEVVSPGEVRWMLADNQGTIRDVLTYAAGQTTVADHLRYDAFGKITSQSHSDKAPTFSYTGRQWDADAQMYYYRERWYDPRTGRFASEDPAGFGAGDVNLARYCGNSPANFVDPSGMGGIVAGLVDDITTIQSVEVTNPQIRKFNRFKMANDLMREQGQPPVYGEFTRGVPSGGVAFEAGLHASVSWIGCFVLWPNLVHAGWYALDGQWVEAAATAAPAVAPAVFGAVARALSGGGRGVAKGVAKAVGKEAAAVERGAATAGKPMAQAAEREAAAAGQGLPRAGQAAVEAAEVSAPKAAQAANATKSATAQTLNAVKRAFNKLGLPNAKFKFRGASRIDSLRGATHAQIVGAFEGTGLAPTGHFIHRIKDARLTGLGLHSFRDLEGVLRYGSPVFQDSGTVALVYGKIAVIIDPVQRTLVTIMPW